MRTNSATLPPWLPDTPLAHANSGLNSVPNSVPSWMAPRPGLVPPSSNEQSFSRPPPPAVISIAPPPGSPASIFAQAIAVAALIAQSERPKEIGPDDESTDEPLASSAAVSAILPDAYGGDEFGHDDAQANHHAAQDPHLAATVANLQADNARLREQLAELTLALGRARRDVLARSESELVRLSLTIAERVVRQEIATDPSLVAAWAREAVGALVSRDNVVVAIAPDIASSISDDTFVRAMGIPFRLEVDPTLPRGGCEVRSGASTVDACADGRLAGIRSDLSLGEP